MSAEKMAEAEFLVREFALADPDTLTEGAQELQVKLLEAAITGTKKPSGKITMHWLVAAYDRVCAGESADAVLADYGFIRTGCVGR